MRWILRQEKRRRHRTLNIFLKGWQDHVFYNRHLMQTNMAAIQFGQQNQRYLMRNVFDELRQHCERRKYELLHHAVHEDMDVAIAKTTEFNATKSAKILNTNKNRAGNIVRDMLGRRLFAYFDHWVRVNEHYKVTM